MAIRAPTYRCKACGNRYAFTQEAISSAHAQAEARDDFDSINEVISYTMRCCEEPSYETYGYHRIFTGEQFRSLFIERFEGGSSE